MGKQALSQRLGFIARTAVQTVRRPRQKRDTSAVLAEYSDGWARYRTFLDGARDIRDWMRIPTLEDVPAYYNVEGKVEYSAFDSAGFYRRTLLDCIRRHFPSARSVTEFGCGVGRNLLYLKINMPHLTCYGYELCQPGVDTARAAAIKYGFDVQYAQLDYLEDPEEKYVFPTTDIGFTMFSLEQLPTSSDRAVDNILRHVRMGSIHMEPVPENYPISLRGLLGRIEHQRVDYLGGFDQAARTRPGTRVAVEKLASAHNPLMFPSVYILSRG